MASWKKKIKAKSGEISDALDGLKKTSENASDTLRGVFERAKSDIDAKKSEIGTTVQGFTSDLKLETQRAVKSLTGIVVDLEEVKDQLAKGRDDLQEARNKINQPAASIEELETKLRNSLGEIEQSSAELKKSISAIREVAIKGAPPIGQTQKKAEVNTVLPTAQPSPAVQPASAVLTQESVSNSNQKEVSE